MTFWWVGNFKAGLLDGDVFGRSYSTSLQVTPDGTKIRSGVGPSDSFSTYVDGVAQEKGTSFSYPDISGQKVKWMSLYSRNHGQLHGTQYVYEGNRLSMTDEYVNGVKSGESIMYLTEDAVGWREGERIILHYDDGEIVGTTNDLADRLERERIANEEAERSAKQKRGNFWKALSLGVAASVAGNASGMSAEQAIEFGGSMTADVVGNTGGANTRALQESYSHTSGAATNGGTSAGNAQSTSQATKTYAHTFSCSGRNDSTTVDIPYKSRQCLLALKQFSEVMSCNDTGQMQQAQADCTSMCGRSDCYEE